MPKGSGRGHYERKPHTRITKQELKKFIMFCMKPEIKAQLALVKRPHQLAPVLYEKESGIKISTQTAYNALGKWVIINGELIERNDDNTNDNTNAEQK